MFVFFAFSQSQKLIKALGQTFDVSLLVCYFMWNSNISHLPAKLKLTNGGLISLKLCLRRGTVSDFKNHWYTAYHCGMLWREVQGRCKAHLKIIIMSVVIKTCFQKVGSKSWCLSAMADRRCHHPLAQPTIPGLILLHNLRWLYNHMLFSVWAITKSQ